MKVVVNFLLLFVTVPGFIMAQQQTSPDSLLSVLRDHPEADTAAVNTLNALSFYYDAILTEDSALFYGRAALEMAVALNYKKGQAVAYRYLGNSYLALNILNTALEKFNKSIDVCKQIRDLDNFTRCVIDMGLVYIKKGAFQKSFRYFQYALDVASRFKIQTLRFIAFQSMAHAYLMAGSFPQGLEYNLLALQVAQQMGKQEDAARINSTIGSIYLALTDSARASQYLRNALTIFQTLPDGLSKQRFFSVLGQKYMEMGRVDTAIHYFEGAIQMAKDIQSFPNLSNAYMDLAIFYQQIGQNIKGLDYIDSARIVLEQHPELTGNLTLTLNTGYLLINIPDSLLYRFRVSKQQRYQVATDYAKRAIDLAVKMNNVYARYKAVELLMMCCENRGDYKNASEYLIQFTRFKDSVVGQQASRQVVQKEMQFEFEKKAAAAKVIQMKKDARQDMIRKVLLGGLMFLGAFLIVGYGQNRKIHAQQRRSESLLLNILPRQVATELKLTGKAKARHFDDITVLFTDFVNFSEVAEKLSPGGLVSELNACFSAFDHIMERHGLEKIKTVGEAYLAVSGLPRQQADHAERAARAALEILSFMEARQRQQDICFSVRIGLNSGPVVAGIVGVKKFAYDIWGDTVNTAARMEQCSEAGRINISESTYTLIKSKFQCSFRGALEAKNKGKLNMYYVDGVLPDVKGAGA